MPFTQAQISRISEDLANLEEVMNQLLSLSMQAIMKAEREEHNEQNTFPSYFGSHSSRFKAFSKTSASSYQKLGKTGGKSL